MFSAYDDTVCYCKAEKIMPVVRLVISIHHFLTMIVCLCLVAIMYFALDIPLQICAMIRDMSVGVRVEAFNALGKIAFVSEDTLLQSVSKKLLGTTRDKQLLTPCSARPYEVHLSSAAGVFIHGLEDEYSEVKMNLDPSHSYLNLTYHIAMAVSIISVYSIREIRFDSYRS